MASIFLTGATGYVGGEVLKQLVDKHPEYKIAALIRDGEAAKHVTSVFPSVRAVVGSLDDSSIVEEEASQASVVLRTSPSSIHLASNKHLGSFQAIQRGLAKRSSPSFWIQISGASALAVGELSAPGFEPGVATTKVWDDLADVDELRALVRAHPSRVVDNFLLDAAKTSAHIKTAILMPPIIYGQGAGPKNQRSIQIPTLCKVALERGKAIRLLKGESSWGNIHVHDLGAIITALAEAGASGNADDKLWGDNGIYTSSNGTLTWADISQKIADAGKQKGLLSTSEVEEVSVAVADTLLPAASVFFGSNARSKSRRAAELLGWKPVREGLDAEIPRALDEEAARLGAAKI